MEDKLLDVKCLYIVYYIKYPHAISNTRSTSPDNFLMNKLLPNGDTIKIVFNELSNSEPITFIKASFTYSINR